MSLFQKCGGFWRGADPSRLLLFLSDRHGGGVQRRPRQIPGHPGQPDPAPHTVLPREGNII